MLYNIAYARGMLQAAQRVNDRRELSRGSGRAAACHGCEHKTCYMICGGVVATEARARAAVREHGEAARSGRPRWTCGKISPDLWYGPFQVWPLLARSRRSIYSS